MTSDEFFDQTSETFDIIFIDGLHHSEQVYRDIINSLAILNIGGTIVCHDMNPQNYTHQLQWDEWSSPEARSRDYWNGDYWNGDCWKAWMKLRSTRDDLEMCVIDADFGVGVIREGIQEPLVLEEHITYCNLEKNRHEWLNLISLDSFKNNMN